MTPVFQRIKHDPPRTYGDCHRAAVATLLDMDYEDVPHFADSLSMNDTRLFNKRQDEWLASIGLTCIVFPVSCYEGDIELLFESARAWNPELLFLLGVTSDRGFGHTVVASPYQVVHDPSLEGGKLTPMCDGFYWLTYIVQRLDGVCVA